MKSTYKLLGALWDGLPFDEESPVILENFSKEKIPRLSLSRLLSFSSMDEVQNNLVKDGTNHSIIIDADFYPASNNKVVNSFYNKRVRQIVSCLCQHYPEVLLVKHQGE